MWLKPDAFRRSLETGALSSAWLVAGDDPFRVGEASDLIRARARKEGYVGRDVLFVERNFEWEQLSGNLNAMSLFAERRIVELRMPQAKPGVDGSKALIAALDNLPADVLLLLITDKIEYKDLSSAWVKAFDEKFCCYQVNQLSAQEFPAWVTERMRRVGLVPDSAAVQLVAERCEGNSIAAHQEVELLALLCGQGPVSVETVAESVATSARYHVFTLGEAMLLGDGSRAVRIMDGLAAEGEEPTLVLWVVAEELRSILQSGAKSGSSGRLFKGGALRKERLAMAARRVPKRLVQDLLLQAAQVDGMIKSARKDEAWGALTKIATTLCIAVKNRAG